MTIISYVCAEFHNRRGEPILTISPAMVKQILTNVPEEIRDDPLFRMMVDDGSLTAVDSVEKRKQLENDPLRGITPEGKAVLRKGVPEQDLDPDRTHVLKPYEEIPAQDIRETADESAPAPEAEPAPEAAEPAATSRKGRKTAAAE